MQNPVDEDATLPLPEVPNVPPEKVLEVLNAPRKMRCGACQGCTQSIRGRPGKCLTRTALKMWEEQLGAVSLATVREFAEKLAIGGRRTGTRCGKCKNCRRKNGRLCAVVACIVNGTLPQRFQAAAPEPLACGAWQPDDGQQVEGWSVGQFQDGEPAAGDDDDWPSASDSDDDIHWAGWASYMDDRASSAPPAAGQGAASGPSHLKNAAARPPDWVCRAWMPPQESTAGMEGPAGTEECGCTISGDATRCQLCGMPRWSGPGGQLRARVVAALQTGALRAAGWGEVELAGTIAARIAHEIGTDPQMLLRLGAGDPGDLVGDVAKELQAAKAELLQARNERDGSGSQNGCVRESTEQERAYGRAARKTCLGKAIVSLEGAVAELIDEQAALREYVGIKAAEEDAIALSGEGSELRHQQRQAHGNAATLDVPTSPLSPGAVGYSAFCNEVKAALGCTDAALSASLTAICELLFTSAPEQGWDGASMEHLSALLRDSKALAMLQVAVLRGGPAAVLHAVHACIAAQKEAAAKAASEQHAVALAALEADLVEASPQGLLFPPTQQSQPDPGEARPSSQPEPAMREAEAPAAAPAEKEASASKTPGQILGPTMGELWMHGGMSGGSRKGDGRPEGEPLQDAEQQRIQRLQTAGASTVQFLYSLTHAVLNEVSISAAEARIPPALRPTRKIFKQ